MVNEPETLTIPRTAPAVICDENVGGTAVLVDPGTYTIESIDFDEAMVYIEVPAVEDFYVAVHTDWLNPTMEKVPTRRKKAAS